MARRRFMSRKSPKKRNRMKKKAVNPDVLYVGSIMSGKLAVVIRTNMDQKEFPRPLKLADPSIVPANSLCAIREKYSIYPTIKPHMPAEPLIT
jgi:hypothetical protein